MLQPNALDVWVAREGSAGVADVVVRDGNVIGSRNVDTLATRVVDVEAINNDVTLP